jgi:hypothetical protein
MSTCLQEDLGADVSGDGISELIMTVLAAVAQFVMAIRDAIRAKGFAISHQTVARTLARQAQAGGTP